MIITVNKSFENLKKFEHLPNVLRFIQDSVHVAYEGNREKHCNNADHRRDGFTLDQHIYHCKYGAESNCCEHTSGKDQQDFPEGNCQSSDQRNPDDNVCQNIGQAEEKRRGNIYDQV